ncbi:MAG: hypothetical protein JSS49_28460 [Planctomycetes bacterium]|nr:hypothetical protein [Planctomycetota bacterium]
MSLQRWLAISTTIVLCGATLGCPAAPPGPAGTGTGTTTGTGGTSVPAGTSTPKEPAIPLSDWKTPAAAFLLTGEQHGYFEPCGCSLHQLGGMARRGDLVRMLAEERQWPLSGLDAGGTLKRNRRQDQIKFSLIFNALKHMHYAAAAAGLEELKLGADFLLQQQQELKESVPLLGANIVLFDQADLGWPLAFRVVEVGKVKVGVTAVFGTSLQEQVAPVGAASNITFKDPAEVLPGVIKALEAESPDFLVLISHGSEQEAKELAEKFPQFRIILTTGGLEEPDGKPIVAGKTWILQTGHKGKRVGVLGYFPDDPAEPFKFALEELDDTRFKNDPYMRKLMKDYQQQIEDEQLAVSDELLLTHPSGNRFVGAAKCGECHTKAYEHWKDKTKHAHGLESLKKGHPGQEKDWIVRIHDPECLSCHVTGWEPQQMLRFDSGYLSEKQTPQLADQQCENCHGPGSRHVSLEETTGANMDDLLAARNSLKRTKEQARHDMCVQCHDSDNSPKFNPESFNQYWSEVAHPWKD